WLLEADWSAQHDERRERQADDQPEPSPSNGERPAGGIAAATRPQAERDCREDRQRKRHDDELRAFAEHGPRQDQPAVAEIEVRRADTDGERLPPLRDGLPERR